MARTQIEIPYHCGRGVAKSRIEQYIVEKGFKQNTIKRGTVIWFLRIRETAYMECLKFDYGDDTITVSAFIGGMDGKKKYTEDDLTGLTRYFSKMKLRRVVNAIKKKFK